MHRADAARLFRLALERRPAGSTLHAVADEGVPIRDIAEVIGRHLDLPGGRRSRPRTPPAHFSWLAGFLGADSPASSALTRELLGWQPTRPGPDRGPRRRATTSARRLRPSSTTGSREPAPETTTMGRDRSSICDRRHGRRRRAGHAGHRPVPHDPRQLGHERVDGTVADDLGTTITGIQTAITLYTLVMATLMITGGKIGTIIGRRKAFAIGCVIYGAGSFTTGVAPNLTVLIIGWSFLEGIGAALILPGHRGAGRRQLRAADRPARLRAGRGRRRHRGRRRPADRRRSPPPTRRGGYVFFGEVLDRPRHPRPARKIADAPAEASRTST